MFETKSFLVVRDIFVVKVDFLEEKQAEVAFVFITKILTTTEFLAEDRSFALVWRDFRASLVSTLNAALLETFLLSPRFDNLFFGLGLFNYLSA